MKTLLCVFGLAGLMAGAASAATISYNTTGSTLSCNGISGCTQDTSTSITDGGLTLTYNSGSGSGVVTPSIINLGNIVSTGTGTNVSLTGLRLTININSTPGGSGTLPSGAISGQLSTSNSSSTISFSPSNTTTTFGTLPGVVLTASDVVYTYQVLNTNLGLQAPTVGNPIGQTSIQGDVTSAAIPEPSALLPIMGLGLIGLWRRRAAR